MSNAVCPTLFLAVVLVGVVVLVFLQDWRAMILPMIDVPVSLIGTFAVMAAMGYSLNNISLFGLVLAIGIVVDDAIVVLENIERQMAERASRPLAIWRNPGSRSRHRKHCGRAAKPAASAKFALDTGESRYMFQRLKNSRVRQ